MIALSAEERTTTANYPLSSLALLPQTRVKNGAITILYSCFSFMNSIAMSIRSKMCYVLNVVTVKKLKCKKNIKSEILKCSL